MNQTKKLEDGGTVYLLQQRTGIGAFDPYRVIHKNAKRSIVSTTGYKTIEDAQAAFDAITGEKR